MKLLSFPIQNSKTLVFLILLNFSFSIVAQTDVQEKTEISYGRPDLKPSNEGAWVTGDDVKQIKASKIIVAQIGNKDLDDALYNSVKKFWTFTSDIEQMPYNKAIELANQNKGILVFSQTETISSSNLRKSVNNGPGEFASSYEKYKRTSFGRMIMIEDGKQEVLLGNNIPSFGDEGLLTEESLTFGVSAMNSIMLVFDKYNLKHSFRTRPKFKKYAGDRIKNRTLLIPKELLKEGITESVISKKYKGKFKIVPYEDYRKAILNKEKGMAYVIFSPMAVGGKTLHIQYIMDAEDGLTLGIYVPSGNSIELGPGLGEHNVSGGNTGEITKKCLKGYKKIYKGTW